MHLHLPKMSRRYTCFPPWFAKNYFSLFIVDYCDRHPYLDVWKSNVLPQNLVDSLRSGSTIWYIDKGDSFVPLLGYQVDLMQKVVWEALVRHYLHLSAPSASTHSPSLPGPSQEFSCVFKQYHFIYKFCLATPCTRCNILIVKFLADTSLIIFFYAIRVFAISVTKTKSFIVQSLISFYLDNACLVVNRF